MPPIFAVMEVRLPQRRTVAAKTDSSPSDTKPASEGAAAKPATEGAKVSTVEPSANPTPSAAASS